MTVCGFSNGFAWADGEAYGHDGQPLASPVLKLGVSSGGFVEVGCGYMSMVAEFRRAVAGLGRTSFAGATATLPAVLRQMARLKRAELRALDLDYELQTAAFGLCGFVDGRFRGVVFYENRDFEPVEADAWTSPTVNRTPNSAADVLAMAQKQLRFVQVKAPSATGRQLTIARRSGRADFRRCRFPS